MSTTITSPTERVRIQIGSRLNSSNNVSAAAQPSSSSSSSSEAGTAAAIDRDSEVNNNITLYSLCDSHYLRKGKRKAHMANYTVTQVSKAAKPAAVRQPTDNVPGASQVKYGGGPQVEIVNGQIVLKESSLVIGANEPTVMEDEYEEVEEEVNAMSKYSSFLNNRHSPAWGIEETRLFYDALRQCGTEFSLMQTFFPNRTRKQLKKKFIREENLYPELVKHALSSNEPLEMMPFEVLLGEKLTN